MGLFKKDKKAEFETNNLLNNGYYKICDNFFLNENDKKIVLQNKTFDFKDIVDCNLVEDEMSTNGLHQSTTSKFTNNGKIKSSTLGFTAELNHCTTLYVNVTVNDFENPNIKLDFRKIGLLIKGTKKYKKTYEEANKAISVLKLIIIKNKS